MRPFGCPVTIHLGKFDGKADEGFFVGYFMNSKAFRVFNSKTRIVEENLHIRFSESTPNIVGNGPDWLFDIDALTRTMNYEPIVAGTQSNGFVGTKASDNVGQARKETEPVKYYILLPLWTADPPFSQNPKSSDDDGSKPSSDVEKKVNEDPRKETECNDQEKEDNVNNTNNVNTVSSTINAAGTNENNAELPVDPNMPALEDYSIFDLSSDDKEDVIGDLQSATQTRNMSMNLKEEPKKVIHALKDPSWIEAMNKKDERAIVIRNKARLVAQGYTQEEGIDYDEVFSLVVRIKAIRLFLAYASFKDFVLYQMDVKTAFLYRKIEEEVYVCQPPGFEDPDFPDRVYKVEKALYGLHQAPRAWYETLSTYLLDNGFQRGKIDKTLFIKRYKDEFYGITYLGRLMLPDYFNAARMLLKEVSTASVIREGFHNDPKKDSECKDQEKEDNVNSTNNVNIVSSNSVMLCWHNMRFNDDEDDGVVADMNNLDTTIKEEPKKVIHALNDPSWIEAMQEELLQFKLQKV
ncbi:retrovirus-related pol polyprotein from transposon TNT 1-94 [Tanacetum coccineum]